MKTIESTKGKITAVIIITCVATAIASAIIFTRPQLQTVNSSFIVPTLPIKTTMDVNKYVIVAIKDKDLIDSVAHNCDVSSEDLRSRIAATIDGNKSIGMTVSWETAEKAAEISENIIMQMNNKISGIVRNYIQSDISETEYTIKAKEIYIDSLKHVMQNLDSTIACEVSKNGSRKDQLIEHKILLEKNPDYIFASKLMEKFASDYGTSLSSLNENKKFFENDKNYITVIKSANPNNSHSSTNKTKSLIITAFIAFICSICIVVFWNMIFARTKTSEKAE